MTPEEQLIEDLAGFSRDPLGFVMWAFPWGEPGPLANEAGPEPWQIELLQSIAANLTPMHAVYEAVSSGNGVGKSAVVSWIILWAHSTFADTRGVVTSNTESQLKTKTWAELGKWFNMFIAKDLFELTATSLFSRDPGHKLTWRTDMIAWSANNVAAFQGLHNSGKRQFMIFDEASGIDDGIWDAAEGCMTDINTERLWLVCGNPNKATGRFRECFPGGRFSAMWNTRKVDSRGVRFSDLRKIGQWINAYGEDHDFVRVRVKGEFPRVDMASFIGAGAVADARARPLPERYGGDPLVMGVDVARFGDDATRIVLRRGRDARTIPVVTMRGADTMQVAGRVSELFIAHKCDAVFVDGGGVGGGVVDRLRQLRVPVWDIQFGAAPDRVDPDEPSIKYANKRAEIWGYMRSWMREGCIPDDEELKAELLGPQYGYNAQNAIQLERKEDMKKRGLSSPDWADALALTFSFPVVPFALSGEDRPDRHVKSEYDPFSADALAA